LVLPSGLQNDRHERLYSSYAAVAPNDLSEMVLAPADPSVTAGSVANDPTDSPAGAALAGPLQAHIVNAPSGESSPQDSANTQPPDGAHRAADADPDPDGVRTVVIHEGDTLDSVAWANLGSDEPVVIRLPLKANPQLANANLIHPGEVLQVPVVSR